MNIVLLGKTGSGKTAICNWLTENLRYDKIVTYTTRLMRPDEVDGEDYHFVSDRDYDVKDLVLKTKIYGSRYGTAKEDLVGTDCKVIIVDPEGLKELKQLDGFDFVSFFVACPTHLRYCRCVRRGDSPMLTLTRIDSETYEFDGLVPDYTVDNSSDDIHQAVSFILEKVKEASDCLHRHCIK